MTLTSLKPPMSGTRTSMGVVTGGALDRQRIGFFRVDAEGLHGVGHRLLVDLAVVGERLERGARHVMPVHFEKARQLRARVAAAIASGAEHGVSARYPLPKLIRDYFHVVGGGDEGALAIRQGLLNVVLLRRFVGMQWIMSFVIQC